MANPEQIKLLKEEGVMGWTKWRAENRDAHIDLSGEWDMTGINFSGAQLQGANCHSVILTGANLSGADLTGANLENIYANRTNFTCARLSHANLKNAILPYANFTEADLSYACLAQTEVGGTLFVDVDLTHVVGLERCWHLAPSNVDQATLTRSRGVPREFWQGCGLSPEVIEQMAKLYHVESRGVVFISHTGSDKPFARNLARELNKHGYETWFDEWEIKVGDSIIAGIEDGIRKSTWMVVVLSPDAIKSEWVMRELRSGLTRETKRGQVYILPILRKDVELPPFLADKAYADFRSSADQGMLRLLASLTQRGPYESGDVSRTKPSTATE